MAAHKPTLGDSFRLGAHAGSAGRSFFNSLLVAAALGFAALSQLHGISFVFGGFLGIGATLAELLAAKHSQRRAVFVNALALAAVLGASWIASDVVISGRFTQIHLARALPPVTPDGVDKTWQFERHGVPGGVEPHLQEFVAKTLYNGGAGWLPWLIVGATLLGALVTHRRAETPLTKERAFIVAATTVVLTVSICAFFTLNWSTYVPRRTALNRFVGLMMVALPILGSIGAERMRQVRGLRATGWVFLAACAALPLGTKLRLGTEPTVAQLVALRPSLAHAKLVLTNGYSSGLMTAVVQAPGLEDGRGPFHDEALLDRALSILIGSRRYFAAPEDAPFDFDAYGVTHILARRETSPDFEFTVDEAALARNPRLRRIAESGPFVVYEVASTPTTGAPTERSPAP